MRSALALLLGGLVAGGGWGLQSRPLPRARPRRAWRAKLPCATISPSSSSSSSSSPTANPNPGPDDGLLRCSIWDVATMQQRFEELGVRPHHVRSIYKFMLGEHLAGLRGVALDGMDPEPDWTRVPELPKRAAEVLAAEFTASSSRVTDVRRPEAHMAAAGAELNPSPNPNINPKPQPKPKAGHRDEGAAPAPARPKLAREVANAKLGVELRSGLTVETVLIGHGEGAVTVCVSSQVGCAKGCKFCETGTMGLRADLGGAEILEQLWHAARLASQLSLDEIAPKPKIVDSAGAAVHKGAAPRETFEVTNVVFMGMGEPLDNVEAVVSAVGVMTEYWRLAPKRITVSTVGDRPDAIRRLAGSNVQLALSLHAPNEAVRQQIVPTAKFTTIPEILAAVEDFIRDSGAGKARDRVMVEYVVIKGVNDGVEHGRELGQLLSGHRVWVNLIPYNPTSAGARFGYEMPDAQQVMDMANAVREGTDAKGNPMKVRIRWSTQAGQPLEAACGQLAVKKMAQDAPPPASA
mmetsp:Transcript_21593/g.65987  ORF Transcript_21593/g.65987 Transcript_21593/m.65987 type:complete len:521 (-) Transcript_21593:58-1620(-)|eukprot:CAMPEP_0118876562 /NCGR_PEP_ID=MMETSP1163-20130328/17206_1 /TAXON_ID=124430 /ORGANISM="Phaeomonas parva, Strain CCMP2877" /LENGTH=520 /DNA_ID=CAMNT_0006812181 /DNA_START=321 /DNA_END=1883 /DNA_ORIENTATION=-